MQTITENTMLDHIINKYDINMSKTSSLQIHHNQKFPPQVTSSHNMCPFFIFLYHTSQTH